jgi:hypothetical protein
MESEEGIPEAIEEIKKDLREIKRDSLASQEDQLFFGFVISITLFVIALPIDQLASSFEDFLHLGSPDTLRVSETIKNISIVCLVCSSLLRYYASVKPHKGARLWSFYSLMVGLDFFIITLAANVAMGLALEIQLVVFPLALVISLCAYVGLGKLESKILGFYADKHLVLRRYSKFPLVSYLFALLTASVLATVAVESAYVLLFGVSLSLISIQIVYYAFALLFFLMYLLKLKRKKII